MVQNANCKIQIQIQIQSLTAVRSGTLSLNRNRRALQSLLVMLQLDQVLNFLFEFVEAICCEFAAARRALPSVQSQKKVKAKTKTKAKAKAKAAKPKRQRVHARDD